MISRRGRGGRAIEDPSNDTGDMAASQDWVLSVDVLQREENPDLKDELAQFEGILPINKDIALAERVWQYGTWSWLGKGMWKDIPKEKGLEPG